MSAYERELQLMVQRLTQLEAAHLRDELVEIELVNEARAFAITTEMEWGVAGELTPTSSLVRRLADAIDRDTARARRARLGVVGALA
jgi:hypothetical protein